MCFLNCLHTRMVKLILKDRTINVKTVRGGRFSSSVKVNAGAGGTYGKRHKPMNKND